MFFCEKCGECCKHLDRSDLYKDLDRGDGVGKYLKQNICSIYDKRPIICRVDESYYSFFKEQISLEDYYKLNYDACNKLKKEG